MKLAICGRGKCGKDTVCAWLKERTRLRYHTSTSEAAAKLCYQCLRDKYGYSSIEAAYADRRNHREEWARIIDEYNEPDGVSLYRDMLETNDILNGIRRGDELAAVQRAGYIDIAVWIDRDVPDDPTLTYDSSACDIIIENYGTLDDLYRRLARFARVTKQLR